MSKSQKKSSPTKAILAVVLIVCSYIPHALPKHDYGFYGSLIYGALYYLGGILLADYVIERLSGTSLTAAIFGSAKQRLSFIKLGLLGALPFSLAVSTFGGLWYFPYWSAPEYYVLGYLLLGWAFYFLFLAVCYAAFKVVLDHIIPQHSRVTRYYAFERKRYKALGVIGGWIAIMVITVGLQDSRWLTDFHVAVNKPQTPYLYWYWWLIAIFAWVVLCEFMEYHRKRSSLLKDTLHGYFTPLIAVFLCGITLAITNEVQNLPINLWHYANFPWTSFALFKIPLFVIFSWPLQILAFVEFWRAFGDPRVTNILFMNAAVRTKKRTVASGLKQRLPLTSHRA